MGRSWTIGRAWRIKKQWVKKKKLKREAGGKGKMLMEMKNQKNTRKLTGRKTTKEREIKEDTKLCQETRLACLLLSGGDRSQHGKSTITVLAILLQFNSACRAKLETPWWFRWMQRWKQPTGRSSWAAKHGRSKEPPSNLAYKPRLIKTQWTNLTIICRLFLDSGSWIWVQNTRDGEGNETKVCNQLNETQLL